MVDLDEDIHGGIELLVADAPAPATWETVNTRRRLRRRRRTVLIGAVSVGLVLVLIATVARVSRDDTSVVMSDGVALPCGSWIAVHTLFDSSANSKANLPGASVGPVTADQAAFLVKSGDVPDRVAQELGGSAGDYSARVVARPNPQLGTINITASGNDAADARRLADAFSEALLASAQDIQQREFDRQRDVLNSAITQLELELAGVVGDDRGATASRERLSAAVSDKKVQLQELDQQAAQGSNIYSFGSSEAFQVTDTQLNTLFYGYPPNDGPSAQASPRDVAPDC